MCIKGKAGPKPAAGPANGGPPGGLGAMSPEDQQKARQQMEERFRKATPEQRKAMLQEIPEGFRDRVKESLKAAGMEVKD